MSKKRLSFDAIVSTAGSGRPGFGTWFDRLSEEDRSALATIRQRWRDSGKKPPAATMARAIVAHCKEAGIDVAGEVQVSKWLKSQS